MASLTSRALVAILLLASLAVTAAPAHAGSSHPYFDDAGTLVWYHRLADAQRAARAEGKVIFVEYGRRLCGSCKVLCSRVLPDPRVRSRLAAVAVGLASECDRPEAPIQALFDRHLRNAHMLPFAAFLTPDGQWITGFAGSGTADSFLAHLALAERSRPRPLAAPRAEAPARPVPTVRRAPARPAPVPPRPEPAPAPAPATPLAPVAPPQAPERSPCVDGQVVAPPTPPSVELAEADRAGRTSVNRGGDLEVPPANLHGSPDATVVEFPPTRRDLARETCRGPGCRDGRPEALPAPVVSDVGQAAAGPRRPASPPRRQPVATTAPRGPGAAATSADQRWADERLDFSADAVAAGRYEEGLAAIEEVLDRMPGEAAFVDAARGLDAIKRLLQQRFLDPDGQVAQAARRMAYEDMWGTRWARLFK